MKIVDQNEAVDKVLEEMGQIPLTYYDPLTPILNRRNMKKVNKNQNEINGAGNTKHNSSGSTTL